jgi:cell division protein FtsI (penicillin-binding protein 3)
LETRAITENETIYDSGKIKIQGWEIRNYDYSKHPNPGLINLVGLFQHSSNIGTLKIALKMAAKDYYKMLCLFGLGQSTGIDLPGESAGILPHYSKWATITQANISFGYSLATTPIQLAAAVSAIANKGVWITPHVIKYEEKENSRIKKRKVLSEATCTKLIRILTSSIEKSDAEAGKIPKFRVAGKTGTSRKPVEKGKGYSNNIYTSFVGFFPIKDPQILIMVVVDSPKTGNSWGSTVAGPVFNAVATEVTRVLNLESDKPDDKEDKKEEEKGKL